MTGVFVGLGILLCLLLSGFFSASEMAYSSCNTVRLENLRDGGNKRAGTALKIVEHFDDTLSAILIGNNLVNIAASSLSSVFMVLVFGSDNKTWIATAVMTLLVIIFGETIPKITAKKNANSFAVREAPVLRGLTLLLYPLIRLVVGLIRLLTLGMKGEESENADEAVEELQSIIETAEDEEVLDEDRSELLQAAIEFQDVSAFEVMTARVDMQAIDIDDDWDTILAEIEEAPFSRLPVYEDSVDNIIGVLYLNHFLKAVTDGGHTDIRGLLMQPCYIYKTTRLPQVLSTLRKARQHLAIVTDEYGGTLGVITMEDVLEEIVGDIWDETDKVEPEVVQRADGEYELDGGMAIDDFRELLGLNAEQLDAESDTLGGWCVETYGSFPKAGDSFRLEDYTVTVLAMDGRRVERVLVKKDPPTEPEPKEKGKDKGKEKEA